MGKKKTRQENYAMCIDQDRGKLASMGKDYAVTIHKEVALKVSGKEVSKYFFFTVNNKSEERFYY